MSQAASFTIVTPSEVCQHSSNLSKMIKHKSGKVFRWHQDKLHTTLDGTTPVKYSLGGHVSPSLSNNYSWSSMCEQRSPSVSSSTSSTSSYPNTHPQHLFENPPIDQHVFYQTLSNPIIHSPTHKITKPYKARDSFKFFDYTMKKRKRTKRCDQVQPYENVISFTMTGVSNGSNGQSDHQSSNSSNSCSSSSSANSTGLNSDAKFESTLHEISQYIGEKNPQTITTYPTQQIGSVSTAPFSSSHFSQTQQQLLHNLSQPRRVRTSISIKELLN
ncbi:predicted protein [Naegleria gruberi]|uniref:Predicted protein n=1 Tax=Naegleria gruberi TaxID=5762 RepID=D2VNF7_NAEGR|nr:uncharacterized protein NAEGRDRAFT_80640 [Naegleria gruberi]EFC41728.1 predicted protein [Naegleria gruberi]|eukprot:XP_002674472.1 predicted protein [Naegleria gruberi strain NEG-M]